MKIWKTLKPYIMIAVIAYVGWLVINFLLVRFVPSLGDTLDNFSMGKLPGQS